MPGQVIRTIASKGGRKGRPPRISPTTRIHQEDIRRRKEDGEALALLSVDEPNFFVRNMLRRNLWQKQREILDAVWREPRVAVQSCHASGKSYLAATAAVAFLNIFPDSIVITTAPTFRQVEKVMWAEIKSCYNTASAKLAGRLLGTEIKVDDKWFAMGVATDDPNRLQGLHSISGSILVIMDEASGFDAPMWEAIEAILTGTNSHLLMIGNPTDPSSQFARECAMLPKRAHFTISAYDTPNLNLQPGEKPTPGLITHDWVDDKKVRWGETSPMYVSRVLGQFPDISIDNLIQMSWIAAAQRRWEQLAAQWAYNAENGLPQTEDISSRSLGVDVARQGDDETVIAERRGIRVRVVSAANGKSTMETADDAKAMAEYMGCQDIKVDSIGIGAGVVDRLKQLKAMENLKPEVHEMNAAERAVENDRFTNCRSEWAWALRERFQEGRIAIDPEDTDLAAEISSMKYRISGGRIQLESKEDMKKRLGHSPDRFDAIVLACAPPRSPTVPIVSGVPIAMPVLA